MSLERELQALKKRVQRIGFQESPPELGIVLTKGDEPGPKEVSPWQLWIHIEDKPPIHRSETA